MQVESFLETSAARTPEKIALICSGRRFSYRELDENSNTIAHSLLSHGIGRGDRVAICLDNSVEAVLAVFAVLKAGAVFLVVNPTTKADKLTYILANCRARGLVTDVSKLATLEDGLSGLSHLTSIWLANRKHAVVSNTQPIIDISSLLESAAVTGAPPKTCIDIDLAALIYTSGSTGRPKGVMLTHLNIVSAATSITTYLENTADDIILNVLPLAFDYGLYQLLMAFKVGATLVLERSFAYPYTIIDLLNSERVTGFPIVPTMSAVLLQLDLSRLHFSSLRYISNTAAALPVDHIRRLRQAFPSTKLYSMYGLTECKRVSYLPPSQLDIRPTSVGRGMPNEEVFIVDETGQRVGPNTIGELAVRGSNVMKGYWELPDETSKMLKPGAIPGEMVLYTGDLFKMDEEGYLYFVGRKDDIIKTRGEKVSPREVEDVLHSMPGVAEAAVIGIPDAVLGEAIRAVIALRPGSEVNEKEVMRYCAARLEDFMVPKSVCFLSSLPKTSSGKVSRRELAACAGVMA